MPSYEDRHSETELLLARQELGHREEAGRCDGAFDVCSPQPEWTDSRVHFHEPIYAKAAASLGFEQERLLKLEKKGWEIWATPRSDFKGGRVFELRNYGRGKPPLVAWRADPLSSFLGNGTDAVILDMMDKDFFHVGNGQLAPALSVKHPLQRNIQEEVNDVTQSSVPQTGHDVFKSVAAPYDGHGENTLTSKDTNPKDALGVLKARWFSFIPLQVLIGVGLAFYEGARKYAKFNWRIAGVKASVYVDAAVNGHIMRWYEGEDIDDISGVHHIDKAIASLMIMRDSMLQGNFVDDRPPRAVNIGKLLEEGEAVVAMMAAKYPNAKAPFTEKKI